MTQVLFSSHREVKEFAESFGGDRIAQMVLERVSMARVREVKALKIFLAVDAKDLAALLMVNDVHQAYEALLNAPYTLQ